MENVNFKSGIIQDKNIKNIDEKINLLSLIT